MKTSWNSSVLSACIISALACPRLSAASTSDSFDIAAHNGFLKIVVTNDGVTIASWRSDIICVDPRNPQKSRQFSVGNASERDPFTYDLASNGIYLSNLLSYGAGGGIDKHILLFPYSELKSDPFEKQSPPTDKTPTLELPGFKFLEADLGVPFRVLTPEDESGQKPLPFVDLSTLGDGLTAAFEYGGNFYVWEWPKIVAGTTWTRQFKVSAAFSENFVCYRAGDDQLVHLSDGRQFKLTAKELLPIVTGEKLAPPATETQIPQMKFAIVVDRTPKIPTSYRLVWREDSFHRVDGDNDKSHDPIAAAATRGVDALAAAPSVEFRKQLQKQETQDKHAGEPAAIPASNPAPPAASRPRFPAAPPSPLTPDTTPP